MKILSRLINIILYIIVGISLFASIGTYITKTPMIISAVRSNSMYPLFQRGDMIIIKKISPKDIKINDIVVFKPEKGRLASKGWIVHRIIDGNNKAGYITKGDANKKSDQYANQNTPIKPEWIACEVITLGNRPLKIRYLGYIPILMEEYNKSYVLPAIACILMIIIGVEELYKNKRKKKKKNSIEMQLIYFISGLTLTILMAATMLMSSNHIKVNYEVSENSNGIILGSDIGIIKVNETIEKPFLVLNNKGFFPIITVITNKDIQCEFDKSLFFLKPGDSEEINIKINAKTPGKYESYIWVGMFYPLLPSKIIYYLAYKNFWLALIVLSTIPGLPIMLYPMIDNRLRRKTFKELSKYKRRILNNLG